MTAPRGSTFFPNLNGLRAIAAGIVVVDHIERVKFLEGHPSLWSERYLEEAGGLAVTLFFTLSGFLITWLLLEERDREHTVSVGRFYARRILRIWPVYYLVVCLGLFVLPRIHWLAMATTSSVTSRLGIYSVLYLAFLPNVATIILPVAPFIVQTWSIGVEEQFYLTWPWVIKWARHPLPVLVLIFAAFASLHLALDLGLHVPHTVAAILKRLEIDCMAIGAIAAVLWRRRAEWFLRIVHDRRVFWLLAAATGVLFVAGPDRWRVHEPFSIFLTVIIVHLATSARPAISLTHPVLDRLGIVSYGIYMYHWIPVVTVVRLQDAVGLDARRAGYHVLLYVLAFAATIGVAFASYRWFESPLLRLKERFAVVHLQH